MASAGVSCTVTFEDQRSYIKIETLRGKNPTDIHSALREVCGEQTVDRSTVSRWATRFREGRVTINDDQRPARPKTSTDKRSVKLVEDFFLHKIVERRARKYHKLPGFHRH
jgi:transposase